MSSQSQSQQIDKKEFRLPDKIPITYTWFGKSVPQDYMISLSDLNYPLIFIKNAELNRKFNRQIMDIQKSDYYRLQYLYQHGGIYSDFDNYIDYECLMKLLQPFRNQEKLIFMTDGSGKHTRSRNNQMMNNLIFAPYPKMPILKRIIDDVDETKQKIWGFAGMRHVAKYSQPIQLNMDKCVIHSKDWSWFSASNQVLNKNNTPHAKFSNKLVKKKQVIEENIELEQKIQKEQNKNKKLQEDLNRLQYEYKLLQQQISRLKNSKQLQKQPNQIASKPQEVQDIVVPSQQVEEQSWHLKQQMMKQQIQQLSIKNQHLQFQRNTCFFAAFGSLLTLLILLTIGCRMLKKKNHHQFSRVGNTERSIDQIPKKEIP